MDLSLLCQSRSGFTSETKRGIVRYPASVLAPGPALGLLLSIALSSAQVGTILIEQESHDLENRPCYRSSASPIVAYKPS